MNTMMIRLLSAISLAVVAILSADLSASTETEVKTQTDQKANDHKSHADHAKKHEVKHAKEEAKPTTPVTITKKTMNDVEGMLSSSTIVDARGSGDEAIKGAIFLAADANDKDIHAKLKDKAAMIVIYCGSVSCPASMTLAERLVGLGYTNVCHYAGGIKEWTENQKPTTAHKSK